METKGKKRPNRIPFTTRRLDALPRNQRDEYSDIERPSLKLRVTRNGTMSFSFAYRSRVTRKKTRLTLGRYDGRTVAERKAVLRDVRRRHAEATLAHQAGRDPQREKKAARDAARLDAERETPLEPTFQQVFEEYLESSDTTQLSTWSNIERGTNYHWIKSPEAIGHILISELRVSHVRPRIDRLVADGLPGGAKQAKKYLSGVLSFAVRSDYCQGNVASSIRIKRLRSCARALSDPELGAAFAATSILPEPWRQACRLLILTACRKNEILESRWSEITDGVWLDVPPERTKMDRARHIALCEVAQRELKSLTRLAGSDLILTVDPFGQRPLRGIYKVRDRWCKEIDRLLGVEGTRFRLHDLRHTAKTHMTKLGVIHDVSEAVLGHEKVGIISVYDHHRFEDETQEAAELYSRHVLRLAAPFMSKLEDRNQ